MSTFCAGNPVGFHAPDGSGYGFWAEQVIALDALNPQVASRLARAMDRWRRYTPALQAHMKRALQLAEHMAAYPQASLRADRAGVLEAFARELDEGLLFEARTGRATLTDPEMLEGMQRFAAGERPEPPRPPK